MGEGRTTMEGDLQLVPVNQTSTAVASVPHKPPGGGASSNAIVEYTRPVFPEEEEDLEIKLRRIIDNVPVRCSNTSGSSAGSGSGDFHQYRQMRRKEQDRLARIEVDYQRRKEVAEFEIRREHRLKVAEEQTAKKRLKRQKKKQSKKEKKPKLNEDGRVVDHQIEDSSANNGHEQAGLKDDYLSFSYSEIEILSSSTTSSKTIHWEH